MQTPCSTFKVLPLIAVATIARITHSNNNRLRMTAVSSLYSSWRPSRKKTRMKMTARGVRGVRLLCKRIAERMMLWSMKNRVRQPRIIGKLKNVRWWRCPKGVRAVPRQRGKSSLRRTKKPARRILFMLF